MRILWLSVTPGLYQHPYLKSSYNGGGWISSLQNVLITQEKITLALAFVTHIPLKEEKQNNTIYYPIFEPSKSSFQKLKEYYGGYKNAHTKKYINQIQKIIIDFKPDIIHLFGLENPLSCILGKTQVPIVVHLQGILSPYDNAFFPAGFNKFSFLFPFSFREWILRNGYIFAKNNIHVRGERELNLFHKIQYVMGRTHWDYQISHLFSPKSKYFHVDEVLRESFYENMGKWSFRPEKKLIIISTISNTIYKGLDTVLKTAKILKKQDRFSFKWQIVGIQKKDEIVHFFEHKFKINSEDINIEYLGVLNESDLCKKLLESHIYVHPSYIDNSPNSICEAQILGMPVIGTYVGGIPSLITNQENGVLIPANAPFELSYILEKCFKDINYMSNLGYKASAVAQKRHNKSHVLKDLLTTYSTIIKENPNDNL